MYDKKSESTHAMENFCLNNPAGFLWTMVGKFLWIVAYFNTQTLFQIIVTFAFYLTAYNFRIPGCNCNHIVKVTAPLQHHARESTRQCFVSQSHMYANKQA